MMDAFLRLRVEPTESLSRLVCLLAEQVGEEELQKTFSTLEEARWNGDEMTRNTEYCH